MSGKKRIRNVLLLAAASSAVLWVFFLGYRLFLHNGLFDEGLVPYGAARILEGAVPYRDFWTIYAPLVFYLLAAVFKLFGASIIVERALGVVVHALIALSMYYAARPLVPRAFRFLACLLAAAWLRRMLFLSSSYSYAVPAAVLFVFLGFAAMSRYFSTMRRRWLFVSGMLTAIVALCRQDFGFYVFAAHCLVLPAFFAWQPEAARRGGKNALVNFSLYILGNCLLIAPAAVYLAANSALAGFFRDAVIFPLLVYPGVRGVPFPAPSWSAAVFYFPVIVFAAASVVIFDELRRGASRERLFPAFFSLVLGSLFLGYPLVRAQVRYLLPSELFAILLFVYIAFAVSQRLPFGGALPRRLSAGCAAAAIAVPLFFLPLLAEAKPYLAASLAPGKSLSLSRSRGCYDRDGTVLDQQEAVRYIQERVKPSERIFVGNTRHDKAANSDVMFYFLAQRKSATRYHELHPGLTDTRAVQEEIIGDLAAAGVRYIILSADPRHTESGESNGSAGSGGATRLDDFIRGHYSVEKIFGPYRVLKRKDLVE